MEAEGTVYGYRVSERVAERTGGAWRPGPGTVYPLLRALVERGLARSAGAGRRRVYRITPQGRRVLKRIREGSGDVRAPDLGVLWAEVVGASDTGRFLVARVGRAIEGIEAYVARPDVDPRQAAALRHSAARTLDAAATRLRTRRRP